MLQVIADQTSILVLLGFLVTLWRLLTFTLRPYLFPNEPKEIPYWIPLLGHTFAFFNDYTKLIENGSKYVSPSQEPFSIQLLGQKLYICTSPKDVSVVFDSTADFNFDNHMTNILTSFGISPESLKRAWHKPKPGDWCYIPHNPVNPKQKSLIHCVEDIYNQQLLPGDRMNRWSHVFLDSLSVSIRGMDDLRPFTVGDESCGSRQIPVYSLVSHFNVQATTRAMFGPHLHEVDPLVVKHMVEFNEHVWMAVFRCPNIIGLELDEPRRKLMAIMRDFVTWPPSARPQASWAITNILAGMEQVDIDMESRASMLVMIFWAAVSNEHNACYWLLIHLLYDESLLENVRIETEAAWKSEHLDIKHLCSNSPNLDAIFNEVLRLNNTAAAIRIASKATTIGGKLLPSGSTVVLPFRQLHINQEVWGPDVYNFNPTRFLKNKSLTRNPSFRPFGGGSTLCPGQTLARQEIFGFIAILLHRFNLRLVQSTPLKKPPFPRLNSKVPSFGLNGPVKGTDILVAITSVKN
ncbi:cytochrome P450 [Xylaria longipes]|nr:cytochrome P450 [Xylaria longipes]